MLDNNFGKCRPIFKFFFRQVICKKILYVHYITKISASFAICCYISRKYKNVTDFDSTSADC